MIENRKKIVFSLTVLFAILAFAGILVQVPLGWRILNGFVWLIAGIVVLRWGRMSEGGE